MLFILTKSKSCLIKKLSIPVSNSWILIKPFVKPEMTMVPVELLKVSNESIHSSTFGVNIFIRGPTGLRQADNGKRWQVFLQVSRTSSASLLMLGYSSTYDSNLPRKQICNSFSTRIKMLLFLILV